MFTSVFPLLCKQKKQNAKQRAMLVKKKKSEILRPAVAFVLDTGQGEVNSVSVSVQVLKSMYIK